MPDNSRTNRACDRCHSVKEKCRWPSDFITCERCARLKYPCLTRRPLQKAGRKSRSAAPKPDLTNGRRLSDSELDNISVYTSSASSALSCRSRSPDTIISQSELIQRPLPLFCNLDEIENNLLKICLGNQASVGRFTIGPSFHESHQRVFVTLFNAAMPQLKDALLSCAIILAGDQNIHLSDKMQEMCQRRAGFAVSSLRSFRLSNRQDISVCLILGVAITTFALYVAGGESLIICRSALNLAKPAYESMIEFDPDEISFLICLAFSELVECLFHAERPTLRMRPRDVENIVDRFLGLSTPLLPHLYDICCMNESLRCGEGLGSHHIIKSLEQKEKEILEWTPTTPAHFPGQFEEFEITSILAQSTILRLATLLILHRMRYAYGTLDAQARKLADAIFEEIDTTIRLTGRAVKGLDFGFMIASFELSNEIEQQMALQKLDSFVKYSPQFLNKLQADLILFWKVRKTSSDIYWFNLHEHLWTPLCT